METLNKIFEVIKTLAGILAVFGVAIEVTPIKISPLKWMGKRINKDVNDKIDKMEKRVSEIEYSNDMKDLRNIKSRIHSYGLLIQKGEKLPKETLKSALDDLDVYDYYKETYHYMEINGRKVKINGEVEADRILIMNQMTEIEKRESSEQTSSVE